MSTSQTAMIIVHTCGSRNNDAPNVQCSHDICAMFTPYCACALWASVRVNLSSGGLRTNTGTDQPTHPRCLISAFVIRFLESVICKLATDEIAIF